MNVKLRLAFLGIVAFSVSFVQATERPSRRDCIVKFDVDWSKFATADVEDANRRLARIVFLRSKEIPIAGAIYGGVGRSYYFQFHAQCPGRYKMTRQILAVWKRDGSVGDAAVSSERVEPSTHTIDIVGDRWRD